jgi:hypothetical protein
MSLMDKLKKSSHLIDEESEELTTAASNEMELCMLLSKLDVQNLLLTHDQIAQRYEQRTIEQQQVNQAVMQAATFSSYTNFSESVGHETYQPDSSSDHSPLDAYDGKLGGGEDKKYLIEATDEELEEGEQFSEPLSEEGRFLLAKAAHYAAENLKLVNIEKTDAPLGATIRNRDGSIVIGRIVVGGVAEQTGLLHEDDEILEINNIPVRGKTINDICDVLVISFYSNCKKIINFLFR